MDDDRSGWNWIWKGLSVLFVLIGLAAVLGVLVGTSIFVLGGIWNWVWNLIGLFIFLWILSLIVRFFLRPLGIHHYYDYWNHDNAVETLRRRYARGEIGKEQYEQMMNDLKR